MKRNVLAYLLLSIVLLTACVLLAKEILDKPIKVRSKETMQYINYIKKEFETQNK